MELSYLKKLIRLLEQSGVDEIEIEEEGLKIRLSKGSHGGVAIGPQQFVQPAAQAPSQPRSDVVLPEPAAQPAKTEPVYHEIKSPIVGTFYRAPAPDADAYVEVGQIVKQGTVLCIIEAMKLMNEIESDFAGRIVKIVVENAQPVEYNQTLFLLEPI